MKVEQLFLELRKKQQTLIEKRLSKGGSSGSREIRARSDLLKTLELEGRLSEVVGEIAAALGKKSIGGTLPVIPMREVVTVGKRALPLGTHLETSYKGKRYKAIVNDEGKLVYKGTQYNSIAMLATEITGKDKNHLRSRKFWSIEVPK